MKGQAIGAEAHVALLHRSLQELLHFAQLCFSGLAADAVLEAHDLDPQHGVGHEGCDVRPQRHLGKVIHVVAGVIPGDFFSHLAQHGFGDVLYSGEAINDRLLLARLLGTKAGAEAAVAHQHRGRTVAHHLG